MVTENTPTKEEILEALGKNGINNLEELIDVLMPETSAYKAFDWNQLAEETNWPFKLGPRSFTLPDSAITGDLEMPTPPPADIA